MKNNFLLRRYSFYLMASIVGVPLFLIAIEIISRVILGSLMAQHLNVTTYLVFALSFSFYFFEDQIFKLSLQYDFSRWSYTKFIFINEIIGTAICLIEIELLSTVFNFVVGEGQFILLSNAFNIWQQLLLEFCVGIIAATLGSLSIPVFHNKVLAFLIIAIVANSALDWLNYFTKITHGAIILMILTIWSMLALLILYYWINRQREISPVKSII